MMSLTSFRSGVQPSTPTNRSTSKQAVFAVINVNMARLVVADKPLQDVTAAPDFAQKFQLFVNGTSERLAAV